MTDSRLRTWAAAAAGALLLMGLSVGPAAAADESVPADSAPATESSPADSAPDAGTSTTEPGALAPAVVSGTESFTVTPKGPWTKGQKVSVNFKGWTPGQLVVALTCPKGVWPAANPPGAGCSPFTDPSKGSNIGNIKPDGTLSLQITIQEGALAGTSKSCSTATPCTIGAYGTDEDAGPDVGPDNMPPLVTITYVGAASGGSGSGGSGGAGGGSSTGASSGGSGSGASGDGGSGDATGGGSELAASGAETADLAIGGAAAVLLGLTLLTGSRFALRREDARV